MRLLGRSAEAMQEEGRPLQDDASGPPPQAAPAQPDYAEVGQRVTGVLNAAEEAAAQIRAEAESDAARTRQEAEREADQWRMEANRRRQEAEQEALRKLAEAEAEGKRIREEAEATARETEAATRRRQEELREETRVLEEHRQRALYELRDIAAGLQDVLLEAPGPKNGGGGDAPAAPERDGDGAAPDTEILERDRG